MDAALEVIVAAARALHGSGGYGSGA